MARSGFVSGREASLLFLRLGQRGGCDAACKTVESLGEALKREAELDWPSTKVAKQSGSLACPLQALDVLLGERDENEASIQIAIAVWRERKLYIPREKPELRGQVHVKWRKRDKGKRRLATFARARDGEAQHLHGTSLILNGDCLRNFAVTHSLASRVSLLGAVQGPVIEGVRREIIAGNGNFQSDRRHGQQRNEDRRQKAPRPAAESIRH